MPNADTPKATFFLDTEIPFSWDTQGDAESNSEWMRRMIHESLRSSGGNRVKNL